jgi:hypothetical protein
MKYFKNINPEFNMFTKNHKVNNSFETALQSKKLERVKF